MVDRESDQDTPGKLFHHWLREAPAAALDAAALGNDNSRHIGR
jgi:hypothetical protein